MKAVVFKEHGSAAIQISKLSGAEVITTVGNDEKAKELGADHVITHSKEDFADKVNKFTDGRGVDVVFEHIGPETWEKSLLCLKRGGRIVTCGATSGPTVSFDLRFFLLSSFPFQVVIWEAGRN